MSFVLLHCRIIKLLCIIKFESITSDLILFWDYHHNLEWTPLFRKENAIVIVGSHSHWCPIKLISDNCRSEVVQIIIINFNSINNFVVCAVYINYITVTCWICMTAYNCKLSWKPKLVNKSMIVFFKMLPNICPIVGKPNLGNFSKPNTFQFEYDVVERNSTSKTGPFLLSRPPATTILSSSWM